MNERSNRVKDCQDPVGAENLQSVNGEDAELSSRKKEGAGSSELAHMALRVEKQVHQRRARSADAQLRRRTLTVGMGKAQSGHGCQRGRGNQYRSMKWVRNALAASGPPSLGMRKP